MKKRITYFYVRHGETIFNLQDRMQGITDSCMTEFGLQQVELAKDALKEITFTKAFCSPSERTKKTAEMILENKDLEAVPLEELKEFHYGILDGAIKDPNDLDMVRRLRYDEFADIGGDSRACMDLKIRRLFDELNETLDDQDVVLIVGHGAYFRHIQRALFAHVIPGTLDDDTEVIPGGGIAVLQFNNGGIDLIHEGMEPDLFKEWFEVSKDQLF